MPKDEPRVPRPAVIVHDPDATEAAKAQEKEDEQTRNEAAKAVAKELKEGPEPVFEPVDEDKPKRAENVPPHVRLATTLPPDSDREIAQRRVDTLLAFRNSHKTNAKTAEDRRQDDIVKQELAKAAEYERLADEVARKAGIA